MFYTVASKLPILPQDKQKKILMIFVIGSVLYALVHYYLYSSPMEGLLDQLKKYLYYIMAVDFGVSYFLSTQVGEPDIDNEEGSGDEKYSPEEMKAIEMERARQQQAYQMAMQRQQMMMQNGGMPPGMQQGSGMNPENGGGNVFKKKEVISSDKKQSSEKEKTPEKEQVEKRRESDDLTDTQLPVFKR
jgi:hypothetical protein